MRSAHVTWQVVLGIILPMAISSSLSAGELSTEAEGLRVELTSAPAQPLRNRETTYTLRLRDSSGKPVDGAKATLAGQMADGMTVIAPLRPARESGAYSGRLIFTMEGEWQLKVRVVWTGEPLELQLTERVGR